MNTKTPFFIANPSGFLFRDFTNTIREGTHAEWSPCGKYVRIDYSNGADLGWYEASKIEYLSKGPDFSPDHGQTPTS